MLKNKAVLVGSLVVLIVIVGASLFIKNQSNQTTSAQLEPQRQEQLKDWQDKLDSWKSEKEVESQTTNLSEQGILQLPNTGPSN